MARIKSTNTSPEAPAATAPEAPTLPAGKKTACPLTRAEFAAAAKPLSVVINGVPMAASVKDFTTGSFGWYLGGPVTVMVGDVPVKVQVGLNMTVANSKEAK